MSLGDEAEMVKRLVSASLLTGISFHDLTRRTGLSAKRLDMALSLPLSSGNVVQMARDPRLFLSRKSFSDLCETLLKELETYLSNNPLKDGISREELKTRLPARSDQRFFTPCLLHLESEHRIVAEREQVKLPGRKGVAIDSNADIQHKLEEILTNRGAEPPMLKELCDTLLLPEKLVLEHLNLLAREGRAVKIKSDIFYALEPIRVISQALVEHLRSKGEITPPEFRELTGLSRKFMIPLLEYFDSLKITMRVGDKRLLRKKLL
jgi:selenocysteine-specific elongation factor